MSQISLYQQDQSEISLPPADGKVLFLDSDMAFKAKASDGTVTIIESTPSGSTPQPIGSPTPGVASTFSRADHVHGHGNQGGGTEHALATESSGGFMSPQEKLLINGYRGLSPSQGIALGVATFSASGTIGAGIFTALCDASAGPITLALPAGTATRVLNVKKIDASANAVTISAPSIDGSPTRALAAQYDRITVHYDGTTSWHII